MKRAAKVPTKKEKVLKVDDLRKVGDVFASELRLLTSNYYLSQAMRKRMDMQIRHLGDKQLLDISRLGPDIFSGYEDDIAKKFKKILTDPVSQWIMKQRGIGPLIAAGLMANIDIGKAPTVGHVWSFAGLNPEMKWEKGQKRPYNAELKQICWHAGQCFMKQSNDPDCFYGKIYRERKKYEIKRNEAGHNAERAKVFKVSAGATKAVKDKLKSGKLPDFNIDARARRYAVKIFLSHLHAVMLWDNYGPAVSLPYSIAMLGHKHFISIPHADMFPGLAEAMKLAVAKGELMQAAE